MGRFVNKSSAQPRQLTITVKYHFTSAGRRPGLPKTLTEGLIRSIVRRLMRHGSIEVDDVIVKENGSVVSLGA